MWEEEYVRRRKEYARLWILLFIAGFIAGILYRNFTYKDYSDSGTIFNEYFIQQFAGAEIVAKEYMKYIIRERMTPLICICILGCLKWKKVFTSLFVSWTGFLLGILFVSAIIWQGAKGVFLCMVLLFPHMLFYALAYGIVLCYFYSCPEGCWNLKKTVSVILSLAVGVVLETYVTPWLLHLIYVIYSR